MIRAKILLVFLLLFSCEKDYVVISDYEISKLVTQDTLLNNSNFTVMSVGRSLFDDYPRVLVKAKQMYLFKQNCVLKNDSIIYSYYPAFVIDSKGEFRKNGIWIYARFENEGYFPFNTKVTRYSVDSIPANWDSEFPTHEGIYFYHNKKLDLISKEQSEAMFKAKERDGFYFIPNEGRLYDKINIKDLY